MSNEDSRLLAHLKAEAESANYSPEALISLGASKARWARHALIHADAVPAYKVDVFEFPDDARIDWPDWAINVLPSRCKLERLHLPDGSFTYRLVTSRGFVLAATHSEHLPFKPE